MKNRFFIALAIGALITAALILLDPYFDYALLSWQMPGVAAAYLFWGAIGGAASIGIAIAWLVNAVIYGLGAFAFLGFTRLLTQVLRN